MSRCLYSSGIKRFLDLENNSIFGTLCSGYHGDDPTTNRDAWQGKISVMKDILSRYSDTNI